jgi:hypothetical protein
VVAHLSLAWRDIALPVEHHRNPLILNNGRINPASKRGMRLSLPGIA